MTGATTIPAETAKRQPSASSVAFLYAHRIASPAKAGTTGTRSLANGVVVETIPLSRMLVIIAFWSLQEAGAIALEPFKEKRMKFIPFSGVRARLIEPVETSGIEAAVMGQLERDKKGRQPGMDLSLLMNLLYRDAKPTPESGVLSTAINTVVALGFAEHVNTDVGAVKHAITKQSRTRLEACPAEVQSLAGAADTLIEGWNAFSSSQPELKSELIAAVRDAFNMLQKNRSSDD